MPAFKVSDELRAKMKRLECLQSPEECETIARLAQECGSLPGDVAELGVFRGETAAILATVITDKTIHLFDSFQGMPESTKGKDEVSVKGKALAPIDVAKARLAEFKNIAFHPGWFPETAKGLEDLRFCFVHFDADLYQATKDAIAFFWPRLSPGGVMLFHDYSLFNFRGVKIAIDEAGLVASKTGQNQAMVRK